ncbi:MAG: hypothetical protein A3J08_02035 [Candidatus Lloydbacteria bacterium RIFCSPLOWO2_02_FULL_51_11]|nr:MAG: hypothetical protein A3J08_02035 [Candidatus Lloydbacteria bacterium RIFCSPLOWO2_02_FULL_51_11]
MEFLKNYTILGVHLWKILVTILGVFLAITFAHTVFRALVSPTLRMGGGSFNVSIPTMSFKGYDAYDSVGVSESGVSQGAPGIAGELFFRNISPIVPYPDGATGDDAEAFEVTDYNASIETRHLKDTCEVFTELKEKPYAIFESMNEGTRNCFYRFKVAHAHVAEVLALIKDLDPKDLSETSYTIKREIDDFTSETEILEKKRASIDETLRGAVAAYEEIAWVATRAQDAEALSKIIDGKIRIIERLTEERISINAQLDRLARAKEEQVDRLAYTYFSVSVFEDKFIDGERIADSWKAAVRELVESINIAVQFMTVRLVVFLLWLVPLALYFFGLLFLGKYVWRLVKTLWQK